MKETKILKFDEGPDYEVEITNKIDGFLISYQILFDDIPPSKCNQSSNNT
jgi:hypothetical protein